MTESRLHRCRSCGRYTLSGRCPACGGEVGTPHPARFSPQDRYARYRRALLAADAPSRPTGGVA
ncbi:MAG TPA: RNA-protein complex protein Nop10 [Thermoplasmata archaeon]|nr:RNA-protein complex protein Nop10 [Thermoplasmata archaeon]